jgi:hypothetical protein
MFQCSTAISCRAADPRRDHLLRCCRKNGSISRLDTAGFAGSANVLSVVHGVHGVPLIPAPVSDRTTAVAREAPQQHPLRIVKQRVKRAA